MNNVTLSQKERFMLQDLKNHEQICIEKYTSYANQAQDNELKQLFNSLAQTERNHLDSINQLLDGKIPQMNQQSGQSSSAGSQGGTGQSAGGQNSGQSMNAQGTAQNQSNQSMNAQSSAQNQGSQSMSAQNQAQSQSSQSGGYQSVAQNKGSQGSMAYMANQQQSGLSNDAKLCTDMLMTEKYVSGTYNTAIFEFRNTQIRNVLNHIQKEEQQHGEAISQYMISKGMYNVQ